MYKKNYFNFKKIDNFYILTNDFGKFAFLDHKHFKLLVNNRNLPTPVQNYLAENRMIYTSSDAEFVQRESMNLKIRKSYINTGTSLHIFVVSKNCNFNCIYCQAGNLNQEEDFLMDEDTAKKAVNIAFKSPSDNLTFEFQGGEPLTNFKIIKCIIEYSKEINGSLNKKKKITYALISNLSLLTKEMIDYFVLNDVGICTSIDGDKELQNINRPYPNHDSYEETKNKILSLQYHGINVGAIQTTTKYSLTKYKKIVDEYINLGFEYIVIRPLTRLGKATTAWDKISYSAEEFLKFYEKTLKYIIKQNKKGIYLVEGSASIYLRKMLSNEPVNYMDMRSPCGGAIGQLAYYYDGNVYTCDEGRMLAEMGDKKFLLGNVNENSYNDLICSNCSKEICNASIIEGNAKCTKCAFMPFCGICPVLNYACNKKLDEPLYESFRCKISKGIIQLLFKYIKTDASALEIFKTWI